jgi:cytochrome c oxidase subunit 3/cytochrome o ubiquinol oxidase subunit 3
VADSLAKVPEPETRRAVHPAHVVEAPPAAMSPKHLGMLTFLLSEVAFFSTLIVTYIVFIGNSRAGPYPAEVLSLGLVFFTTACLLSSSGTIHLAENAFRRGSMGGFLGWWALTIGLGVLFLLGTAYEWYGLIFEHHLTLNRNMFGTTFFTLVGFHAAHVTVGVLIMLIMFGLVVRRRISAKDATPIELTSWYWHFVDGVWIVVFAVVYILGR